MKEKYISKKENGITLIVLVITIIILLILAGIIIGTLTRENGLITRARQAERESLKAEAKEAIEMGLLNLQIDTENDKLTSDIILDKDRGLEYHEPKATNLEGNTDTIVGIYNNQKGKQIGFTINMKDLNIIIDSEGLPNTNPPVSDGKDKPDLGDKEEQVKRNKNESLLAWISQTNETGYYQVDIIVDGKTYSYPIYLCVIEDSTTYNEDVSLSGNLSDADFKKNIQGKRTLIYKYKKDLTINESVNVTAHTTKKCTLYYQENKVNYAYGEGYYGGPLGLFLYVEGTFTNNGTVSMKDRGGEATSQDVILWKYGQGKSKKNYHYVANNSYNSDYSQPGNLLTFYTSGNRLIY